MIKKKAEIISKTKMKNKPRGAEVNEQRRLGPSAQGAK